MSARAVPVYALVCRASATEHSRGRVGDVRRHMTHNSFTSGIPTEIGHMTSLTQLCVYLSHTSLLQPLTVHLSPSGAYLRPSARAVRRARALTIFVWAVAPRRWSGRNSLNSSLPIEVALLTSLMVL